MKILRRIGLVTGLLGISSVIGPVATAHAEVPQHATNVIRNYTASTSNVGQCGRALSARVGAWSCPDATGRNQRPGGVPGIDTTTLRGRRVV
ncbi:hypothetical protein FHU39_001647 [Flexivirga oryzae]|uniref:Secreted protein n=1 Tax=Flexivirga oryzae TaxID=1794944 RepID=A0A839N6H4_9MICO|nr:hypothetical protein [Flexivirga oryzae]